MSVCINKLMCLGFVLCPHKPHPKGNEYHTVCYCGIVIIYGWDIIEVWDHLILMGRSQFDTSPDMKTVGFMLRITRALWSTGKEKYFRHHLLCH